MTVVEAAHFSDMTIRSRFECSRVYCTTLNLGLQKMYFSPPPVKSLALWDSVYWMTFVITLHVSSVIKHRRDGFLSDCFLYKHRGLLSHIAIYLFGSVQAKTFSETSARSFISRKLNMHDMICSFICVADVINRRFPDHADFIFFC